jgi:hypothetical protein
MKRNKKIPRQVINHSAHSLNFVGNLCRDLVEKVKVEGVGVCRHEILGLDGTKDDLL